MNYIVLFGIISALWVSAAVLFIIDWWRIRRKARREE